MSLCVILLNWHQENLTLETLAEIRNWNIIIPKIIVCDNESTARSSATLKKYLSDDELICSIVNLGYGGGINLGLAQALAFENEYVLLLNTDAKISEKDVSGMIGKMNADLDISILGPVIVAGDGETRNYLVGGRDIAKYSSTKIAVKPEDIETIAGYPLRDVDYVSGTVFLARRELFEEIGPLDEQYFFSGEVADFCKRAKDKGHRICVDLQAFAKHDTDLTPHSLRENLYTYYNLRNRFIYVRKHYPTRRWKYFLRLLSFGSFALAGAIASGKIEKARSIMFAVVHGLLNRSGNKNSAENN